MAYSLVVIGILILLYPTVSKWYDIRQEEKLMAEWESNEMNEEAQIVGQEEYDNLTTLFAQETGNSEQSPSSTSSSEETTSELSESPIPTKEPVKLNAIATIKIPSIKLKLPVLEGASQKNMKYAAAHLKETAPIGEVGNAAIAAHRMRAKGRLFNRLNEVKIDDKIIIDTNGKSFTYTVTKVSIVEPTDVSVLNYNKTDKRLTLITCDPVVNPTHRLIVHAEMK
ncbi:class D sortase [Paenibacillus sp. GSMTC-2017]|uniref:class D sortase n=1 Tax=Paenibacillus sp. GSMTC-2017 TaxID=2794350 RepID=UPI001E36A875|nr:class D sortase [Paenibacillus sp. GSMTC-2017]